MRALWLWLALWLVGCVLPELKKEEPDAGAPTGTTSGGGDGGAAGEGGTAGAGG